VTAAIELKRVLRDFAAELGFGAFGIAHPADIAAQAPRLQTWIDLGYNAGMAYLQRKPDARFDARSLLPECRSVIVVGLEWRRLNPRTGMRDGGRIARYAQGDDYHLALRARLKQLAARLAELAPEQKHKITVDTSPIAEKAYAVAAGIGWQGQHSLVLNEQLGSSFMLGLLLTGVELPGDTPQPNLCGTCRRCIAACPTGALAAPAVLDARRCISYWTTAATEHAAAGIDRHGWAYGCDACQDACPYNAAPLAGWPHE
jgi:epoxyqueuosine reductase